MNNAGQAKNVNQAILDEVNASGLWFHAKKTAHIWAKPIEVDQTVETREGRVTATAGEFLCRGAAGELWPQCAAGLKEKYEAAVEIDQHGFRRYLPKFEVMAAQIDHGFQVTTSRGQLQGKPGAYILKKYRDADVKHPHDVWIVDQQLFADSYEKIE